MGSNHNGTTADTESLTAVSRLSFKPVLNRYYCFGLGFEFYTVGDEYDSIVCQVLRLDFLVFSLNFTWWSSEYRKAEWL